MSRGVYTNQKLKGKAAEDVIRSASIFSQIPTDQTIAILEKSLQRFRQSQIEAEQARKPDMQENPDELELAS